MNTVDLTRPAGKPYTQEQREYLQARQKERLEATFQRIQKMTRYSFITLCFVGIGTVLLPIFFSGSIPHVTEINPLVISVAVVGSAATTTVFFYWISWWVQRTENTEILHQNLWREIRYRSEIEIRELPELLDKGLTISLDLLTSNLRTWGVQTYLSQGGDVSQLHQVLMRDPETLRCPSDDCDFLKWILIAVDYGFDVKSLTPAGDSVLHRHLFVHREPYYSYQFFSFWDAGADPTLKNRKDETIMDLIFDDSMAKKYHRVDYYHRYLNAYIPAIARRAPQLMNQPLKNGNSPLLDIIARPPRDDGHLTLKKDQLNIVDLLITHGSAINAQDPVTGDTALHIAAREDNAELFNLLLQKGAKNDIRNKAGQTPLALIQANLNNGKSNIWNFMKKDPKNAMYEAFIVKHLPSGTT